MIKVLKGIAMKKISSVICLSFVVLFFLVSNVHSSSDWVYYSSDNNGNVYSYKKGNIEKNKGKYIVQVWNKTIFSDEGREKEIQRLIKTGLFTETGTKGLSSIVELDEVDCKKKRIRTISLTQYDDDNNVLFNGTDDKSE